MNGTTEYWFISNHLVLNTGTCECIFSKVVEGEDVTPSTSNSESGQLAAIFVIHLHSVEVLMRKEKTFIN